MQAKPRIVHGPMTQDLNDVANIVPRAGRGRADPEVRALVDSAIGNLAAPPATHDPPYRPGAPARRRSPAVKVCAAAVAVAAAAATGWAARSLTTGAACRPVGYSVAASVPADVRAHVHAVFAELEAASGVPYTLQPGRSEVTVAWVARDAHPAFRDDGGLLGWTSVTRHGTELSATIDVRADVPRERVHHVLLHEVGHLAGLQHSADPSSVMFHRADASSPGWTAHDIRRLRLLGARATC